MERKKPKPVIGIVLLAIVILGLIFMLSQPKAHSVVRVTKADAKLLAAVAEAQHRLPEFVTSLTHSKPGERFAVKAAFKTDSGPEYLWIRDPSFAKGQFTGTLDQTPIAAHMLAKGQQVTVSKADVYDWLIMRNGKIEGEFTEQALTRKSGVRKRRT